MALEGDIKDGADSAIQKAFGETPPSLIGQRFARLTEFAGKRLAEHAARQPIVDIGPQKRGVESSTIVVPTVPLVGGDPGGGAPPSDPSSGTPTLIRCVKLAAGIPTTDDINVLTV